MNYIEALRIYSKEGPASNPYAFGIAFYQLLPFLQGCCSIQIVVCRTGKTIIRLLVTAWISASRRKITLLKQVSSALHGEGEGSGTSCAAI